MAQNYFNNDHFKLLNKWKGTVYDKTNPEQQRVYEELGQAYDVTKQWAEALKQLSFKSGWTKTVRKPADRSWPTPWASTLRWVLSSRLT
jgi:5-methylcytosine-specific restriction protein B